MSNKEENHLLLIASNRILGSDIESEPDEKNEDKVKVLFETPALLKISPSRFTISTMWAGPAAT